MCKAKAVSEAAIVLNVEESFSCTDDEEFLLQSCRGSRISICSHVGNTTTENANLGLMDSPKEALG